MSSGSSQYYLTCYPAIYALPCTYPEQIARCYSNVSSVDFLCGVLNFLVHASQVACTQSDLSPCCFSGCTEQHNLSYTCQYAALLWLNHFAQSSLIGFLFRVKNQCSIYLEPFIRVHAHTLHKSQKFAVP